MTKYNLEYLEEKLGTFQKEYEYPTKPISGFNLIYIETQTKKELDETIKKVKDEMNPGYIWGYVEDIDAIYVTRAFGENKIFIYNPDFSKNKTDYVKGKLKVLNNLTSNSINDLFDQKAVFDYFYRKLWDLRLDLGKEIRDKNNLSDNKSLMAAQHIFDRIIFTYFICEKKLVTLNGEIPLDSETLFNSLAKMPDPWSCIKNLFFEQFAKKESESLLLGKNARIITPYLNGGLFRPKNIEGISEIDLKIEYTREQWQNLFEPLNRYTWIIEDEIPDHKGKYEGNLTPEIIGHIYEKFVITIEILDEIKLDELSTSRSGELRKGNKKIGAYYTPDHITDYISRKTIIANVIDKMNRGNDFEHLLNSEEPETLKELLFILNDIKICDPACGSGAFLIKAGEVLLEYKSKIMKNLGLNIDRYNLKKNIIINNLFGIDIQEGAVEICKLRLWLWLISSAKDDYVEPLPNIEYNFVIGNSLVGWTHEKISQNILVTINEATIRPLKALKIGYDKKQKDIIDISINLLKKTDLKSFSEALSHLKSLYSYSEGENAEILREVIEWTRIAIYDKVNRVFFDSIISKQAKIEFKEFIELLNPFHWRIDYSDIFDRGGFDIIIGNPPYVFTRGKSFSKTEKQYYSTQYGQEFKKDGKKSRQSQSGKINLFTLFIERSINLLSNNRYLGFIVPNNLLRTTTYDRARYFILNTSKVTEIVDLSSGVFDKVTAATILIILNKEQNNDLIKKNQINIVTDIKDLQKNNFTDYYINQSSFLNNTSFAFNIYVTKEISIIFNKIEKISVPLSHYVKTIIEGIVTPKGKDKFISNNNNNKLHRKFLEGKDIKRYAIDYKDKYILYDRNKLHRPRSEEIFTSKEKILIQRISGGKRVIKATYDDQQFYTFASINNLLLKENSGIDLKYLLALLNSTLLNAYYNLNFSNKSDLTVNISSTYLEQLPIYLASMDKQKTLIQKVDEMLSLNEKLIKEMNYFKNFIKSETKIQKFSNKFKHYYNEDFETIIKEIDKKKPVKYDKKLLKTKFDKSVNALEPMIKEINILDKDIDSLVYNIYGLNDVDINILNNILK